MPTGRFEIFQDDAGEWRWRAIGANGEVMAQSEGYATKANAERGAEDLAASIPGAAIEDAEG